jgi:hypothetical protein
LRQHPKWGNRVNELVSRWKDAATAESERKQKNTENGNKNPELEEARKGKPSIKLLSQLFKKKQI